MSTCPCLAKKTCECTANSPDCALGYSSTVKITAVTPPIQHGEGPHWDPKARVLYYVDTFQSTAYRFDPKTKIVTSQKLEGRDSIGTITPVKHHENNFLVTADRYFYRFEWDGLKNNSGRFTELAQIEEDKPRNQFNDGKADVKGNMWMGTLTREPDLGVAPHGGSLYRFVPSKNFSYHEKISKVSVSNGLAWSKDNKFMFYIDSAERTVEKWEFGPSCGTLSNRQVLFDLAKYPELTGIPDGMTIDSDDNLYVAMLGDYYVLKIHPSTGEILQKIELPVKYPTSAAFGGPNLDILYVTTSRLKSDERELRDNPCAGAVFEITGLGAKGLPMYEVLL